MLILGIPVLVSAVGLAARSYRSYRVMSNARFAILVAFELIFGAAVFLYLRSRGWRWSDITLPFDKKDLLRGLGVWALGYLIVLAVSLLVFVFNPTLAITTASARFYGHPSVALVLFVSVLNPFFEESLWVGYGMNGPGGRRLLGTILWSVVPRSLVHVYQGWASLFFIAPLGMWYLWYYSRTQRLWPLIIAHGILDLIGLASLAIRGAA